MHSPRHHLMAIISFFGQGDQAIKICTSWMLLMVNRSIFFVSLMGIGQTHIQGGHLIMSGLLSLLTGVTQVNYFVTLNIKP
jgi:hypothetical protein